MCLTCFQTHLSVTSHMFELTKFDLSRFVLFSKRYANHSPRAEKYIHTGHHISGICEFNDLSCGRKMQSSQASGTAFHYGHRD